MTVRTYLDTGVLIAAFNGNHDSHEHAMRIIREDRVFVSSDLLRLELLPHALYNKRADEVEFYSTFLAQAEVNAVAPGAISGEALRLASTYDLAACDALHIHTAINSSVAEFITTEKPAKPFFRVPSRIIKTTSIYNKKEKPSGFMQRLVKKLRRCLRGT